MDNKLVVVYSMKGCPHCVDFKEMLKENNVPAFMLVDESESDEPVPMLFAPEVDFNELTEGVEIIKKFIL